MSHLVIPLEGGARISPGLRHHHESVPVAPEEAEGLRDHSIRHQYEEAEVAVQGITGFTNISEYLI